MAIIITSSGHVLDKKLTVQQGGAAIVGATSILGNTGITGDLGVTGDFGTSGGLSAGGGVSSWGDITAVGGMSAGGDSSFAGDVSIDGAVSTLQPVLIDPGDAGPPIVLGTQAQGQWVEGFNADLLDGLDSTDFMQRATNGTVSAVHTFSPVSVGPAFNLGANAKGQWVDGLNADYLDGLHGSSFLKLAAAQTVTAVHTFNPSVAGAPFVLGANALGYAVSGLNADQVDGLHKTDFLQLATAQTVTARHTINPATAGAPFTLGTNASGQLVTGLNADLLDGNHASAFATSSALSNYLALTGGTLSGNLTVPRLYVDSGGWYIDVPYDFTIYSPYNVAIAKWSPADGKLYNLGGADFGNTVYARSFNCQYYSGGVSTKTLSVDGIDFAKNALGSLEVRSGANLLFAADSGNFYAYTIHTHNQIVYDMTIDTKSPGNDRWDMVSKAVSAYQSHDVKVMHSAMKQAHPVNKGEYGYKITDLLQIAVECIADLRAEVDSLKEKS